jgi:hypothetical protein
LKLVQSIELKLEKQTQSQNPIIPPCREEFVDLAADLETIWEHPQTEARLKKRIVRTLMREIVVDIDAAASEVILVIHWSGGVHTELRLPRRRRGQNSQQSSPQLIDAVRILANLCSDDLIAGTLNRNSILTGRGNRWTRERITALRNHYKIPCFCAERCAEEGWLNLTRAAAFVGVSPKTLRLAVERGEIEALHPLAEGPWIFNRRSLQTPAAAEFAERIRRGAQHPTIPPASQVNFEFSTT